MTIPSVLTIIHTEHICLDVSLHQLAAINTSPLSTCVLELWHLGCIIRSMLLYYQNKCWNTDAFPVGSRRSLGGLTVSCSQLQCVVFSCIIKNAMPKHQSSPFNVPLLFYKGHMDISQTSSLLSTPLLSAGCVVVNDCFALSFLSALYELRDCSIQTGRAVVISAVMPASPDT